MQRIIKDNYERKRDKERKKESCIRKEMQNIADIVPASEIKESHRLGVSLFNKDRQNLS